MSTLRNTSGNVKIALSLSPNSNNPAIFSRSTLSTSRSGLKFVRCRWKLTLSRFKWLLHHLELQNVLIDERLIILAGRFLYKYLRREGSADSCFMTVKSRWIPTSAIDQYQKTFCKKFCKRPNINFHGFSNNFIFSSVKFPSEFGLKMALSDDQLLNLNKAVAMVGLAVTVALFELLPLLIIRRGDSVHFGRHGQLWLGKLQFSALQLWICNFEMN